MLSRTLAPGASTSGSRTRTCGWGQGHRRNNPGDRGRVVPQLLGWGTTNVLVPPTFCCLLGYTRPQEPTNERRSHQNAGFSIWVFRNFPGWYPRTPTAGGGDPLPGLPHSPPARPLVGRKRPGVGTQTLVPLNFSAVIAPLDKDFPRGQHQWVTTKNEEKYLSTYLQQ